MVKVQEDKSQTFRKRRLRFPHLVVESEPVMEEKPDTTKMEEEDDDEDEPLVVACDDDDDDDDDEDDTKEVVIDHNDPLLVKKAQTFRRRRLSLTNCRSVVDGGSDEIATTTTSDSSTTTGVTLLPPEEAEEPQQQEVGVVMPPPPTPPPPPPPVSSPSTISPPRKVRRLSTASVSSRRSSNASTSSNLSSTTSSSLKTVIVHAGELLSQPPPSPALLSTNRLYDYGPMARRQQQQQQFEEWQQLQQQHHHNLFTNNNNNNNNNTTTTTTTTNNNNNNNKKVTNLPRWQKRIIRHHEDDEGILPFPRDVVGIFSCHGVEPIYEHHHHDPTTMDNMMQQQQGLNRMKTLTTTIAKINQDRGGIAFPYAKSSRTALFAVYDGHGLGGELVSQFCLYEVQRRLAKHPDFMNNVEKAFHDTFLAVDAALLREPLIESVYAGTTACVALLRGSSLFLSNVGDSRAVLARRKQNSTVSTNNNNDNGSSSFSSSEWQVMDLTVDQNPNLPLEQNRIESMGGFVSPPPEPGLSARVWLDAGCSQIGLAMSRSLGDHAVKSVGVIAEPVVTRHEITADDEFVIIASDGVWEFITSTEAVQLVADHLDRGATKACQALIEAAAARWHDEEGDYRDDITAMVIRIPDLWTHHPHHHHAMGAAPASASASASTTNAAANTPSEQAN